MGLWKVREYQSFYFHVAPRIWIVMPMNISLPVDTLRKFLHKPLDREESCTPKVHTLDHMNKRARFTERERKCTHTATTDRICCCLDRLPLLLPAKNLSENRQHSILRTSDYTACFLLVSSTFIRYRPLYLHVASHWFNSNVSTWRQVNPPFGFQCSKDWGK